jgi:nucleotide-binding universal stress UspA family protein
MGSTIFHRILVGFDGTDTGQDGLALSMGLAKAFGSHVVVAYVYDEELSAASRQAAAELAEHANAILAGARERVSQALAVEFRSLAASSPAHGLHDLAVGDGAGLIVIGSRRLGPWTKEALGGVSENVLRAAPCAVAVAPRAYRDDGGFVPQRIGVGWVPTDEGNYALEVACEIALTTGGSVEVVTTTSAIRTVEDLGNRARQAARAVTSGLPAEVPVTIHAQVAKAPDELIGRSGAMDLIVLGARGYGPPRTMLLGSVSSRVVPEAHCPTMILATRSGTGTPSI